MGPLPLVGVGVATVAALSIKSSSNGRAVVDSRAYDILRRGLDILSVKELKSPLDVPMLGIFDHIQVLVLLEGGIWVVISFGDDGIQIQRSFSQSILIDRRKQNRVAYTYRGPFRSSYAIYQFYQSVKNKAYNILTWNCTHFTNDLIERLRI